MSHWYRTGRTLDLIRQRWGHRVGGRRKLVLERHDSWTLTKAIQSVIRVMSKPVPVCGMIILLPHRHFAHLDLLTCVSINANATIVSGYHGVLTRRSNERAAPKQRALIEHGRTCLGWWETGRRNTLGRRRRKLEFSLAERRAYCRTAERWAFCLDGEYGSISRPRKS